jgi:hypothetical protein
MTLNFGADDLVWMERNCMKLRIWEEIQLKTIGRKGVKMKYIRSQIKNPNF